MKTLKIFFVLCFIAAFSVSTVEAQNNVKKVERITTISGQISCTGDYLSGFVIVEDIFSPHNWVTLIKKVEVIGYLDEGCTEPSGNVYEISQLVTGWDFLENTGKFTLNGKTIAVFHQWFHVTTDGTVINEGFSIDCK